MAHPVVLDLPGKSQMWQKHSPAALQKKFCELDVQSTSEISQKEYPQDK